MARLEWGEATVKDAILQVPTREAEKWWAESFWARVRGQSLPLTTDWGAISLDAQGVRVDRVTDTIVPALKKYLNDLVDAASIMAAQRHDAESAAEQQAREANTRQREADRLIEERFRDT